MFIPDMELEKWTNKWKEWSNLRKWQIWNLKLIDARLYFVSILVGLLRCVSETGPLVLLPLSKWFLSKRGKNGDDNVHSGKSLKQLVKEYGLSLIHIFAINRLYGLYFSTRNKNQS